ncbi:MAG TPA: UrcA family protein [Rhizomicrobium sp.]|nr:UrcA family protein [Rhizomicrobium sp.]
MTKNRIALLGSALIGAALLCGPVKAQDYRYSSPGYDAPPPGYTLERPADTVEHVVVRPDYDYVEKHQLIGHVNGEVNPVEYGISRPVNFSDLNLSREADYRELRERVRDTAEDLCYQLDARFPELRGDRSADRECVRNATRNAMRAALYGDG